MWFFGQYKTWNEVQGPPTLSVFFELVILGTYKAATILYLGSNWPQLNDIWWNGWKNQAHVFDKFQQSKLCRNLSYDWHEFVRYYLQIKCLDPKNFNLKHESLKLWPKITIFRFSKQRIEKNLKIFNNCWILEGRGWGQFL